MTNLGARRTGPRDRTFRGSNPPSTPRLPMADDPANFVPTAREWAAVFPAAAAPSFPPWKAAPADPASSLRAADPLLSGPFAEALSHDGAAPLAWLVRAYAAVAGRSPLLWREALAAPLAVPALAAAATLAAQDAQRFPARNVALGTVAAVLQLFCTFLGYLWWFIGGAVFGGGNFRRRALPTGDWSTIDFLSWISTLSVWLRRRKLLAEGRDGGGKDHMSPLLVHEDGDAFCPCDGAGCCGDIIRKVTWEKLADLLGLSLLHLFVGILLLATPAFTYASRFWPSPWAVTFFLTLCGWLLFFSVWCMRAIVINTASLSHLEACLQRRMLSLVLLRTIRRLDAAADDPTLPIPGSDEPYLALNAALQHSWATGMMHEDITRRLMTSFVLCAAAAFLLNGIAGCIAAWQVAWVGWWLLYATAELVIAADSNARIARATALYRDAAAEVRSIALRATAARPGPDGSAFQAAAGWHYRALAEFRAADEEAAARLAGVRIDYGVIRTVLASVVTLAAALWGVLRGVGIVVVLETFCPA
ncbi:hypothetical protein DFJ74DRAFT_728810 [Hyaloraphidium curvatum]|nr:hypothetical protein DFJ74DRAFT_728810 [Hyaloraphidium curvatum]